MVAKYSSISTRKLSNALTLLTSDKSMVAMSDYGEFHKMVKRYIMTSVLGTNAQVRNIKLTRYCNLSLQDVSGGACICAFTSELGLIWPS